uniref:Uncharacterized protein n=1 Tax=Panagrolaimus davidi TaxID=227884 RepID=A0A914P6N2_9BILA
MFFAILLALIAIGAGYYIHKQFSPAAATPEVSIPDGSKREKLTASKRDVPGVVSNRSVTDTAVTEPSLRSAIGGTQTQIGEKSKTEQPQRDESSRDVKTARSPSVTEIPSHVSVADAASTVDADNKGILVKDSEGGLGADPLSKQPTSKTPIALETEPSLRSAVGGTETQIGEKSNIEPQRDESSRDVKTARTPTSAENPSHAAAPTADANNNGILVKDSEGGVGANPVSKPPTSKTPIPIAVFEIGNLPDSTARNSPNPVALNQEVKPDPASTNALSEKTATETNLQSATGGTETQKGAGEKSNIEPQRDESSRDVETARSPSVAEIPSAAPTADINNNGILTKDSEGGLGADPVPKSPVVPIKVFEIGNLPDSAAGNASPSPSPSDSAASNSPNPGPSNQEVKPDLATAVDLSEKKKAKKSGKKSKKAKKSSKKEKKDKKDKKAKKSKKEKKSKEIKSADGGGASD